MHTTLAFLPQLGWPEMLIIGIVMLLLFGRRLPEVGKSLGQGIVSFKRGLKDIGDEVETQASKPEAPRFESAQAPASDHDRVAQGEPGKPETNA
ncbi:MAG: twin-arginine translocase TatA/TatE family subunit [Planctomycetota bacterium]